MANTKITTNVIADDAITTAKIADDAVGNDQLASGLTLGGNTTATLSTAAQPNITSLGTLSALTISGDLTVDTSTLKVDSSNNRVGIGTNNPSKKLHVNMGGTLVTGQTYDAMIIQNSDAVQLRIVDAGDGGGNGGHAGLGNDNGNLNIASAGVITFSTALTANEALYGAGAGTGGDERMRIASDGKVGIGIGSPASYYAKNLVVMADGDGTGGITIVAPATDDNTYLAFADGTSGAAAYAGYVGYRHASTEYLFFGAGGGTRMYITEGGLVGIGASPNHSTLEVTGDKTTANNLQLTLRGATNTNKQMIIGFDTATDKAHITSQIAGSAGKPLDITTSAVGIGDVASSVNPNAMLQISRGANTYDSGILINNSRTLNPTTEASAFYHDNSGYTCTKIENRYNSDSAAIKFFLKASGTPYNSLTMLGSGYSGFGPGGGGAASPSAILGVVGSNSNTAADAAFYVSSGGSNDWSAQVYEGSEYALNIRIVSTAGYAFYISDASSGAQRFRITGTGAAFHTGTTAVTSDERKKKNIVDMPSQWDEFKQIRWRNFEWKDGVIEGTRFGVIAQEVQAINPDLVIVDPLTKEEVEEGIEDPKMLSIAYEMLHTKGLKALQEAMERIETLEAEVKALKGE